MQDLISRQAAIDALDKHLQTTDVPVSYPGIISALTEWLNEVPSAQLEPTAHGSIYVEMTEKQGDRTTDGLISRKAAIDAVENIDCSDGVGISALKCEAVDDGVTAIKALPSAQPEMIREIRKWINSSNRGNADYFIVDKIEEIINKYE